MMYRATHSDNSNSSSRGSSSTDAAAATRRAANKNDTQLEEMLAFAAVHEAVANDYGLLVTNLSVCPQCHTAMRATADNQLVCPACRIILGATVTVSAGMASDVLRSKGKGGGGGDYQAAHHFIKRVQGVQGQQLCDIKPEIFNALCRYIEKFRIPDHDLSNVWVGREMLCAIGQPSLYDYVQLVLTQLNGERPPQIPPVLLHEFNILIRHIHRKWREVLKVMDDVRLQRAKLNKHEQLRMPKRNCPNTGLCFNHIAALLGHPELQEYNWSIWEKKNLREKNEIMAIVFRAYEWEFRPVVMDRMARPPRNAVHCRAQAFQQLEMVFDCRDWAPPPPFVELEVRQELEDAKARADAKARGIVSTRPASALPPHDVKFRKNGDMLVRGRNFLAKQALGEEAWKELEDVVMMSKYYTERLSNVNPWVTYRGRVRAAWRTIQRAEPPIYNLLDVLRESRPSKKDKGKGKGQTKKTTSTAPTLDAARARRVSCG